eukprot:354903-Chlamydomonas_euryale.AAC.15
MGMALWPCETLCRVDMGMASWPCETLCRVDMGMASWPCETLCRVDMGMASWPCETLCRVDMGMASWPCERDFQRHGGTAAINQFLDWARTRAISTSPQTCRRVQPYGRRVSATPLLLAVSCAICAPVLKM